MRRTPDWSCWDRRSHRGQPAVKMLRNALWQPNLYPWPKCSAFMGVKGHAGVKPEVKLRRNALKPPNLVGRTLDQSVMYCWGQRSCRGQAGSTTGQIAFKCSMATKFCRKNHWPECNALMGSKVMQRFSGVNQRAIAQKYLRPPFHQMWPMSLSFRADKNNCQET